MPAKNTTKKTDRKKPELKNLDDLFAIDGNENANGKPTIQEADVNNFVPFKGHPFRIYEGERLLDMIDSVRANGVLVPVVARKTAGGKFEILAGHNRINAAKMAGLKTVPTVLLEDITDEEAMVYVVETNLIQRSFSDMRHSEKAKVIAMHHSKMFSQGKRNDILEQLKALENPTETDTTAKPSTSSQSGTELSAGKRTDEKIGAIYSLARNTIARYVRVDKLVHELKVLLDDGTIPFLAAVELSFLKNHEQHQLTECLKNDYSVNVNKAVALRAQSKAKTLDADTMKNILAGNKPAAPEVKPRKVNINGEFYGKYFTPEQSTQEVESIVEEAIQLYFSNPDAWASSSAQAERPARRGLAE